MPGGRSASRARRIAPPAKETGNFFKSTVRDSVSSAAGDHVARERIGRLEPERKHRRDAGPGELGLAIGADVLQEQVAEDDVGDAARLGRRRSPSPSRARRPHSDKDTGIRTTNGSSPAASSCAISSSSRTPCMRHAETYRSWSSACRQSNSFGAARLVQRPGAVFAARQAIKALARGSLSSPLRRRRAAASRDCLQRAQPAQGRFGRALAGFPGTADRAP